MRLPELYEVMAGERDTARTWSGLPLVCRGALRAMWAAARAGQDDPWLVALAGWRYLRANRPWPFADPDPFGWRVVQAAQYRDVALRIVAELTTTTTTKTTGDAGCLPGPARVTGATTTRQAPGRAGQG